MQGFGLAAGSSAKFNPQEIAVADRVNELSA